MLKFTLKQLLHVSMQSPSSDSTLFELAKVIVVKKSVKIHCCDYFGGVAAYFISSLLVYVWCTVWNETHSEQ
jgi:hypothetical protein